MGTAPQSPSALRTKLRIIAGLLVLSTILFGIGIALERRGESGEAPGTHQETGARRASDASAEAAEAPGTDQEGGIPSAEGENAEASTETLLGLNMESPLMLSAFVLISLLLAAALLRFRPRLLPLVILVAGAATLLDIRELLVQVGRANTVIGVLAGAVALTHAAAVVLALLVWRVPNGTPPSGRSGTASGQVDHHGHYHYGAQIPCESEKHTISVS